MLHFYVSYAIMNSCYLDKKKRIICVKLAHRSGDAMALLRQPTDVSPKVSRVRGLQAVGQSRARVPRLAHNVLPVCRLAESRIVSVGWPATAVGHVFVVGGSTDGEVRVIEIVPVKMNGRPLKKYF